jgi:hypothetical protein
VGKRRWLLVVCTWGLALFAFASPAVATAPVSGASDGPTTTVEVASGAPVPQLPGLRIGPFRGTAGESGFRAAWWLLIIGGGQVVALMLLTRRARARIPVVDDVP